MGGSRNNEYLESEKMGKVPRTAFAFSARKSPSGGPEKKDWKYRAETKVGAGAIGMQGRQSGTKEKSRTGTEGRSAQKRPQVFVKGDLEKV